MIHPQEMAPWHVGEWVFFVAANLIIIYFCAPKVLVDVRKWLGGRKAA